MPLESITTADVVSLAQLKEQASHLLFVHANAGADVASFESWFNNAFKEMLSADKQILTARHYRQHETDITNGRHMRFPFNYLGVYALSIDGGAQAGPIIGRIRTAFGQAPTAAAPATWLYYPLGPQVGIGNPDAPMITVAFANPKVGTEAEFREFYTTRHIRHALNVPVLVSGRCVERAQFQDAGTLAPDFQIMAIYEQVGPPEAIMAAFTKLPPGTLAFPMMDTSPGRFAECCYRAIA